MDADFKRRAEAVAFDLLSDQDRLTDPRDLNMSEWYRSVLEEVVAAREHRAGGRQVLERKLNEANRRRLQRELELLNEMERGADLD